MAVKCFRQALQSLKESSLSDNQKTLKSHEITAIIKELRTVHGFNIAFEGSDAGEREAGLPSVGNRFINPQVTKELLLCSTTLQGDAACWWFDSWAGLTKVSRYIDRGLTWNFKFHSSAQLICPFSHNSRNQGRHRQVVE